MLTIANHLVEVSVNPLGAELSSLFSKKFRLEYLWQAGAAWPKQAPVLFPVVGQLKENRFLHDGKWYRLPRHGFARERLFRVDEAGKDKLLFSLSDDEESLRVFPFHFLFQVGYQLQGSQIDISYSVKNTGQTEGWYSFGAHPAFRVPLDIRDRYEDYELAFSTQETSGRWPLQDGLIGEQPHDFFSSAVIPLTKALFAQDALVFKGIRSESLTLRGRKHGHGAEVHLNGCPYLGIWAARDADFVCIEPWHGIADSIHTDGVLAHKEGMTRLAPGEVFRYRWGIRLF